MECCPEHETISPETMAKFMRHSVMNSIFDASFKMRGGRYLLRTEDVPPHVMPAQEPTSEPLELIGGRMVFALTKNTFPRQRMATQELAACLRATFSKLGIKEEMVETANGVFLSDTTLQNLVDWNRQQPLNEDVLPPSELTSFNDHMSSGPLKFAQVFDKQVQSHVRAGR